MARQEKTVNPLAGPLQAFAYDLRKVRVDAGSPTYRALAKAAGYSAATLSEAAGGVRKPTLDVLLAYVGACHGDVELWRGRWQDLQAELAGTSQTAAPATPAGQAAAADRAAATGQVAPVGRVAAEGRVAPAGRVAAAGQATLADRPPAVGAPEPGNAGERRGAGGRFGPLWQWKLAAFLATAVLLIGTVGAFAVRDPDGRGAPGQGVAAEPSNGPAGCPPPIRNPEFTAVTYGAGAPVHTGATRDAPVIATIPPGCRISLVGYCVGEKIHDYTGGTPDVRWFKAAGGGVLASGIVHSNPPAGMAPTRCADDVQGPSAVRLSIATDPGLPGALRLSATGTRLDIVGFAALYGPDQPRRWRQAGFTEQTIQRPVFSTPWKPEPSPAGTVPLVVVAAACLGGDGPTAVLDARSLALGNPPVKLSADDRLNAAAAACKYPA
jgi:hypothetical protein